MKSVMLITLWIAGTLGATVSPLTRGLEGALDARPEALATGGLLLVLAALLRRGQRAKATSSKAVEVLSVGRSG